MHKLVKSADFQQSVDSLRKDYPRIDFAIEGVEAAVERNPHCKAMVFVDYGVFCISVRKYPGIPASNIFYQVAKDEARILYIRLLDDRDED